MPARAHWLLLALFLAAIATFTGLRVLTSAGMPALGGLQLPFLPGQPDRAAAAPDASGGATAAASGPRLLRQPSAGAGAAAAPEVSYSDAVSPQEREAPLIARALSSPDPADRAEAVGELQNAETPEGRSALGEVLRSDPSPQLRMAAVDALRVLFVADMDADGSIRSMLLAATSDADRDVAARAQQAHEEILELLRGSLGD